MGFVVDFFETLDGHVGVDLGGADGGVAEHGLDASKIGSVVEKVRGEAVAEDVGRHVLVDAGHRSVIGDETLNGAGRKFSLRSREAGAVVSPGGIFGVVEVVVEGAHGHISQHHVAGLVALSDDSGGVFIQVEHAVGEIDELGKTEAGRIEKLHDGDVPLAF